MLLGSVPPRSYVGDKSSERQFSSGAISRIIFVNYLLSNCPEAIIQGGNYPEVVFHGGNCPGATIWGGNFPWGQLSSGGDCPEDNNQGVNHPREQLSGGEELSRWRFSSEAIVQTPETMAKT